MREAGVEPATFGFGGQHSIQLSYSRVAPQKLGQFVSAGNQLMNSGARGGVRRCDPLQLRRKETFDTQQS